MKNLFNDSHIQTINDLFITLRQKYLCQQDNGDYITLNSENPYNPVLTDKHIAQHLRHKKTYGICVNEITKFMMFDIDSHNISDAAHIRALLINHLISIGIPIEYIVTEFSGKKGYHVFVFFETTKYVKVINRLQKIIVKKITNNEFFNKSWGNIEIRPTAGQGLKLPLGVHRVTGKICWFCDEKGTPIESFDYLFEIKKIPDNQMQSVFQYIKRQNNIDFSLCEVMRDSHCAGRGISKERFEIGKKSYESGILLPHTRHDTLFSAALYLKACGYNHDKCHQELTKWMSKQDPAIITTPKCKWQSDVDRVVHYIYSDSHNQYHGELIELYVTKDIMLYIYQHTKTKCERLVLFLLLLNQIRFKNHLEDGGFRFSESQISTATNVSRDTVIRVTKKLACQNLILMETGKSSANIVVKNSSLFGNPPTWYRLNDELLNLIYTSNKTEDYKTKINFDEPLYNQMNYALMKYCGIDELRNFYGRDSLKKAINDYNTYANYNDSSN